MNIRRCKSVLVPAAVFLIAIGFLCKIGTIDSVPQKEHLIHQSDSTHQGTSAERKADIDARVQENVAALAETPETKLSSEEMAEILAREKAMQKEYKAYLAAEQKKQDGKLAVTRKPETYWNPEDMTEVLAEEEKVRAELEAYLAEFQGQRTSP